MAMFNSYVKLPESIDSITLPNLWGIVVTHDGNPYEIPTKHKDVFNKTKKLSSDSVWN